MFSRKIAAVCRIRRAIRYPEPRVGTAEDSLPRNAPAPERLVAVAGAVKAQIAEVKLTIPEVIELSGLSEKSFYDIYNAKGNPNPATLVALSAVLELKPQHLRNIISGNAHKNAAPEPRPEEVFARMIFERLAEVALKSDLAVLSDVVQTISRNIDAIIERLGPIDENPDSD
jgi:predicted DNA-binding transcriptional regulator AlpA